jgi:transcriptional antiterminator
VRYSKWRIAREVANEVATEIRMTASMQKTHFSPKELSAITGRSERTIYRMIEGRTIRAEQAKPNNGILITLEEARRTFPLSMKAAGHYAD